MNDKIAYWLSVVFGALALVTLIANVCMINGNRHLQEKVSERQAAINSGVSLSQLNQSLVQALAEASIKDDDKELRGLLAAQGITIKAKSDSAAAPETTKKK